MARRRRRGGRRNPIAKMGRKGISLLKTGIAIGGFGHGAWSALASELPSGNFQNIPSAMIYRYTGFDPNTGQFYPQQALVSAGTLAGTAIVVKLLSWASRSI